MVVEEVDITSLSPDPANVRVHSAAQLEKLAGSLRRWGQTLPLLVDGNNIVRAGNARLAAAKQIGWERIKIVRLNLSPSEWTALAIADNKIHDDSTFDDSALAATLAALQAESSDLAEAAGYSLTEIAKLIGESNGDGVANAPGPDLAGNAGMRKRRSNRVRIDQDQLRIGGGSGGVRESYRTDDHHKHAESLVSARADRTDCRQEVRGCRLSIRSTSSARGGGSRG